jgi:hypothetical protein
MRILLLSICGKSDEPEDMRFMNLYLLSLKKNVIPYYDIRVLLFSTSIRTYVGSLLHNRILELGLGDIVTVLGIDDMELPNKSVKFLNNIHWSERIGLNMNIMFDYAKKNNFFNCDWIFHTDTDIEFLENFSDRLNTIDLLKSINSRLIVTLSGDCYNFFIKYEDTEYLFDSPKRINIYDESSIHTNYNKYSVSVNKRSDILFYPNKILISPIQLKIRNDFVGITRSLAESYSFNWVSYMYTDDLSSDNDSLSILGDKWKNLTNSDVKIRLSSDKGYSVMYDLQSGNVGDIIKVQLSVQSDMIKHFGSGWVTDNFLETSHKIIIDKYSDLYQLVGTDYNV